MKKKIHILLVNLGGPKNLESVKDFLYNLFSDKNIFRLPLQRTMAFLISRFRGPSVAKDYALIGLKHGGSEGPILKETKKQAIALEKALNSESSDDRYKVFIGMQYTEPFIREALDEIKKENPDEIICLPLYPQYSLSTVFSSFEFIRKYKKKYTLDIPLSFIKYWYYSEAYIASLGKLIKNKRSVFPNPDNITLMFSAHGVPEYMIRKGDPYQKQIEETVEKVMAYIDSQGIIYKKYILCYQSKVGPIQWLKPSTEDTIIALGKEDPDCYLLVIPISFVSDHIEVLYEIDMLYGEEAKKNNIRQFERIDSLNDNDFFIEALKEIILEKEKYPLEVLK